MPSARNIAVLSARSRRPAPRGAAQVRLGRVLGHEFVGEVVQADDASLVGARVAGEINLACELTLVGSRCGPFTPAVRDLAAGSIDPTPLIDAVFPLRDAVPAFERAAQAGVMKMLIEVHGGGH